MRKSSKTKEVINLKLKIMIMNYGGYNSGGAVEGFDAWLCSDFWLGWWAYGH